jgi:two-component system, NarL family, nitrate/nitrite response regulator NarL
LTLLVAIVAADPVRRLGLAALVTRAGHQVLESHEGADVVLADDVAVCSDGPPVVALGAAEAGQAGLLPCDATAAQIDAAIRSVAAGLIVRAADRGGLGSVRSVTRKRRCSHRARSKCSPPLAMG